MRVRYPGDKDKIGSEVSPDELKVGEEYLIEVSTVTDYDNVSMRWQGEYAGKVSGYSKFRNVGTYIGIHGAGMGSIPEAMFDDNTTKYSSLLLPSKYGRGGKRSKTRRHGKPRRHRRSRRY